MIISLTHYDSTITITHPNDDLTLPVVIEELIRPLLLAAGYSPDNVDAELGRP